MTTIFEYMGWCKHKFDYSDVPKCEYCGKYMMQVRMGLERENHPLDGNDMVAAINKMESSVDEDGVSNLVDFENYAVKQIDRNETYYIVWLFGSPSTFFRLMQEALDKGIIAAQP
jgi:hypothetical protein